MSTSVEVNNVTKTFGRRYIFKDFNFYANEGEFIAIVGPSGCGKSTLLNMIGLLEEFDSGTIKINGKEIPKIDKRGATMLRRNKINYLFQSYALINDMTIIQNLLVAMNFMNISKKDKIKKAEDILHQVQLFELKDELVNTLSGGEQQRTAIARTILKPGDIILADEPTGSLDWKTAENVFSLIMNLSKKYGKTIIMVTHSQDLASRADRIVNLAEYT